MKPKLKELKNGVKLMVMPLKGMKAVTVEVGVKIGSKYEGIKEHGLSHFLEHMAFKGTTKRPTAAIINKEIDSRGAGYNAGTAQETTVYHVTTVKENLSWAVEILADILDDPLMDAAESLKERERMQASAEGQATVEEVMKYGRKDLINYRQKMLNTREMVVVVAGDVPEMEKIESLIEKTFGTWKTNSGLLPTVKVDLNTEMSKTIVKTTEQAHFCLGVKGLIRGDKRRYALRLLETILAGNSSSRLFQEIREDRGWAYYVDSIGQSFTETGIVGFQSGVKKEKLDQTVDLTKKILIDLHNSIDEDELKRAKQYLRGHFGLAMDRSDFWTGYLSQKMLLEGEVGDLEAYLKALDKVELVELRDLSRDLFDEKEFRTLVIRG